MISLNEAWKKWKAPKKLNVKLLREVALKLRRMRHSKHYNQEVWCEKNSCGTAACVAGWVLLMKGVDPKTIPYGMTDRPGKLAARVLGLPRTSPGYEGRRVVLNLFDSIPAYRWPEPYAERWLQSGEKKTKIAADLLEAIADGRVRITRNGEWA